MNHDQYNHEKAVTNTVTQYSFYIFTSDKILQ